MRITTRCAAIVCVAGIVATASAARADGPEVSMQVISPDSKDPKTKGAAPSIEVTVVGGPTLPMEKFSLSTTNPALNQKVSLAASKLRPYAEGKETLAIALVVCGQMIWIGNEDYETDESAKSSGVLKSLESTIDKLQLGSAGPPGSKGIVISYSTGAEVKVPMGDLKQITGAALGSQKDYKDKIGTDMVQGITMGVGELMKVTTARKALIVVGDGNDTNNDTAKAQLAQLKKDAAKAHIQMFAVIWKSAVSDPGGNVITTMIPTAKQVNSIDGIASEMSAIIARMTDRYYVTFPGAKDELYFPWDGKDHDLILKIDQSELEAVSLNLSPMWAPPKSASLWWLAIVIPIAAILLIIIAVKVFGGGKAVPAPVAMPVIAAPSIAPLAEPPRPAAPMKTVMIGAGGDQDGVPVVGWLVPLNGSNAFQTFRLRSSGTKIGTAPPADIVVNDGFMSTEHCQIMCSPQGFTLVDNSSRNGCYVNDKRVNNHELVDNDLVTLGKTNFKFKSIN
jgi:hypothetical protein